MTYQKPGSWPHRSLVGGDGDYSGGASSGAVKTSISASLWCPLNEVPCKQNI
jgi:hypothetical protein